MSFFFLMMLGQSDIHSGVWRDGEKELELYLTTYSKISWGLTLNVDERGKSIKL